MKKIKKIFLIMSILGINLTGCTMMNDKYDCPLKEGASCISLRDMDTAITEKVGNTPFFHKTNNYVMSSGKGYSSKPNRTKDLVAKIWLAPYEDTFGNYHDASIVYTVIEKSSWVGNPISVASLRSSK